MRVIAGLRKGHPLKAVPGSATRPTTDKVKESLFSIIGPYFDGGWVLDLFAGTGGLAIEALSRGADHAIFIDKDAKSIQTIRENLEKTKFTAQAEVVRGDALKTLDALEVRGIRFDLVFMDPPYHQGLYEKVLERLKHSPCISASTRIIVESDASDQQVQHLLADGWRSIRHAIYGTMCIDVITLPNTKGETGDENSSISG